MGLIFFIIAGIGTAIAAVGFGGPCILSSSIAAGIQSAIGNVTVGSVFASLQSLATSGTLQAVTAAVATGAIASAASSPTESSEEHFCINTDSDDYLDECHG